MFATEVIEGEDTPSKVVEVSNCCVGIVTGTVVLEDGVGSGGKVLDICCDVGYFDILSLNESQVSLYQLSNSSVDKERLSIFVSIELEDNVEKASCISSVATGTILPCLIAAIINEPIFI
jgi:hypothetical protein